MDECVFRLMKFLMYHLVSHKTLSDWIQSNSIITEFIDAFLGTLIYIIFM